MTYVPPANAGPTERLQVGYVGDGTPITTHDPICPCKSHDHYGDNDHLRSTCSYCQCDLIKRARDSERSAMMADGREGFSAW